MTTAEKVGAGVGAILGHGLLAPIVGFGLVPFAIGAGVGYAIVRKATKATSARTTGA